MGKAAWIGWRLVLDEARMLAWIKLYVCVLRLNLEEQEQFSDGILDLFSSVRAPG